MDFAVFYEIVVPRPWTPERERTYFENYIEQVKLADELGFRTIWIVEHHFFEEFSHASAPDLFLCAVARETKRIRLGHGIVICVPEVNNAVRVAERAATLDLLSGGRVELGTGRAATWHELAGFRANPDYTKKSWDEFVRTIPKMWMEERFGYDGQFVKFPRRAVIPKPYQQPHPPLWAAAGTAGTEIDAAERGIGALFLSFSGYKRQEERTAAYRARIASCDDPVGGFINNRATVVNFLYCHEDNELAQRLGRRLAIRYSETGGQASGVSELYPTLSYSSAGDVRSALRHDDGAGAARPVTTASYDQRSSLRTFYRSEEARPPEGLCAGDPHHIIQALKGWEATGVDEVGFLLSSGEIVTHEQVMESLRLFGREVMPRFASKRVAVATAPWRPAPLALGTSSFQITPGSKDPQALTEQAPILTSAALHPEPVVAPEAEVFSAIFEVDDRVLTPLMPPALHVPLPPMVTFAFWLCPDSSVGPFKLAQLRINTRLNARPRGLLLACYFEGAPEAADLLRAHWGFDSRPGKITVRAYHDELVGIVEVGGRQVLRISGRDPNPIEPQDVRDMPNCNPIRLRTEAGDLPRLLQVDPEGLVKQAVRSIHPRLEQIDDEAWRGPGIRQEYPVRALHYRGEFRIPRPRYLIDPALPTDQRSEEIG